MCIEGNQAFGITHTINYKTMTTINTEYTNTELLDQELSTSQLIAITGGNLGDKVYPRGYEGPKYSDSPAQVHQKVHGTRSIPLEMAGALPTPSNVVTTTARSILKLFGL